MKHKGKKIFAIFLVLAMLFSMSSVSFADTADTTTGYNLTGFGNKGGRRRRGLLYLALRHNDSAAAGSDYCYSGGEVRLSCHAEQRHRYDDGLCEL